jgi:hypothetical protein
MIRSSIYPSQRYVASLPAPSLGAIGCIISMVAYGVLFFGCTKPPSPAKRPALITKAAVFSEKTNAAIEKKPQQSPDLDSLKVKNEKLSPASLLMIRACDNYLTINSSSPKVIEVLLIKASVYYNGKLLAESRRIYKEIIDRESKGPHVLEAIRMIAQSFYV